LFTSCWLGITTLHLCWHKLAVLAAWGIFVTAHSSLVATKFAVLITAGIIVFCTQQSCITLLITFYTQVATEGFFWL